MPGTPNSLVTPQGVNTAYGLVGATAKTVMTDTSALTLLYTAPASGALLKSAQAMALATNTATKLTLWSSKDNLATAQLIDSVLAAAYTLAQTTSTPQIVFADITETTPMRLAPGEKVYGAAGVALASGWQFRLGVEEY